MNSMPKFFLPILTNKRILVTNEMSMHMHATVVTDGSHTGFTCRPECANNDV